jgi:hypothetical protein
VKVGPDTAVIIGRQVCVAVDDRVGRGDPVDDLALAGGGLLQRRVAEVDAGVEDADGDAAAVRLRVLLHEVDGARLEGRVVRVLGGGALARRRVSGRRRGLLAPFAVSALGVGSSSAISCRRSMACTEDSFAAAAIAESALPVGTVART